MAIKKYYVTIDKEGNTRWYKDAKCNILHRENGPAIEYTTGDKRWYQNGDLHRIDGAAVEYANGSKLWCKNGVSHREDGPAVEWCNGSKSWCQNGLLHRTDGPAFVYADGRKEWWLNGVELTEDDFLAATQPVVEMTVADIEKLVGKRVKIIK